MAISSKNVQKVKAGFIEIFDVKPSDIKYCDPVQDGYESIRLEVDDVDCVAFDELKKLTTEVPNSFCIHPSGEKLELVFF